MILTQAQAKAVQDAMCALNNINGMVHVRILQDHLVIHVKEHLTDDIQVWYGDAYGNPAAPVVEQYRDQEAFFKAYGLS